MNISKNKKNNQAILLMAFAIGMLLMSYAAVPLYKLFCQVTGYGGTPQKVDSNSSKSISQNISIRFDSSIEKNSIVFFKPEKTRMNVQIGENSLAFFRAVNNSNKEITTMSVFNVLVFCPNADMFHCDPGKLMSFLYKFSSDFRKCKLKL